MTRESGPHRERPDDYHGIPQVARMRYADGDVVRVATAAPVQVAADWSVEARGDTLRLGWPAHRMIWGLMFDMTSEGEGWRGETWYWSHVLGLEVVKVPTNWIRVTCP